MQNNWNCVCVRARSRLLNSELYTKLHIHFDQLFWCIFLRFCFFLSCNFVCECWTLNAGCTSSTKIYSICISIEFSPIYFRLHSPEIDYKRIVNFHLPLLWNRLLFSFFSLFISLLCFGLLKIICEWLTQQMSHYSHHRYSTFSMYSNVTVVASVGRSVGLNESANICTVHPSKCVCAPSSARGRGTPSI